MDVGVLQVFASYGWPDLDDGQVYDEEVRLALLAEELGFDVVWAVEHHFFDYAFCPDNTQWLSYVAAKTERIELGTGAVILPWNDPLRVAEKVALLDQLSGGRVRFGMGRGLSRREYAPFRGIDMDTSRARFDESSVMVAEALETGFIEGDGPFYPQPRTPIRPRPQRSFRDRLYAVANSNDSVDAAARVGARMVMFAERQWDHRLPAIERYRSAYRDQHGQPPPPPMTADFTYCHADASHAAETAPGYMGSYLASLLEHYELMGDHFQDMAGYQGYGANAEMLRKLGETGFLKGFLKANAYGTPDEILETLDKRRGDLGPFELATCFRYGGIPFEEAEQGMRLFAREVLPVLSTWE
ncbi:MAG: LLM class flavin-dependent oxidoreductase [Deltaproteobacteria bacterium]|nr:LLM class flavin-dependent oxidoreductase [Deltaproteobacteria bacterium]